MPAKLSNTVSKIKLLPNRENAAIVFKFLEFMKENGVSERHQNNNLKAVVAYARFLDLTQKPFKYMDSKEMVLSFLNTKIKTKEEDPEQKRITTYNDYLHRIKHFFRWLRNDNRNVSMDLWETPAFLTLLKPGKIKRLSRARILKLKFGTRMNFCPS